MTIFLTIFLTIIVSRTCQTYVKLFCSNCRSRSIQIQFSASLMPVYPAVLWLIGFFHFFKNCVYCFKNLLGWKSE
ncbi:hypothetical protein F5050DRAFT_780694 [Lentinula boryana]|uniref:LITAF domain-containing protein n=1 Tax=Lentinula boryana TaxID=40481 RepID=A0ABQ8Q354_9AGAR|nr:hypothetical protein F5050DRAFT_780694 [Lentinula boryana]